MAEKKKTEPKEKKEKKPSERQALRAEAAKLASDLNSKYGDKAKYVAWRAVKDLEVKK